MRRVVYLALRLFCAARIDLYPLRRSAPLADASGPTTRPLLRRTPQGGQTFRGGQRVVMLFQVNSNILR